MAARWRKQKCSAGLASVGAGIMGYELWDGCEKLAIVAPSGGDWRKPLEGWYWYGLGANSYPKLNATAEEAKAEVAAYVKQKLAGGSKGKA